MSFKRRPDDPKPAVPTYIVTFSDMITLLLTFFVMLLSMAETQVEQHRFEVGVQSFRRAITDFGVAGLLRDQARSQNFDHPMVRHRVDAGQDEAEDRSIDAKTETLRRVMMEIEEMMTISPSHIIGAQKTPFPTQIRFAPGSRELTAENRDLLRKLTEQFQLNFSHQSPAIYVLGLAADTPKNEQWAISAQRAEAVADTIRRQLPSETAWPIYSWGAGNGGDWVGHSGMVSRETQILITVLTETR